VATEAVSGPDLPRRRLGRALLAALLLLSAPALAEGPARVFCRAERAGQRALVQVTALDLFDRDLLHLVRLGQAGRIELEAVLYRRRRLWFDERRTADRHTTVVSWSRKRQGFLVDGAPGEPARLVFPPLTLAPVDEAPAYVAVTVRLEVVTAGSLVQVARWLVRGEGSEGPDPSALGRSLLSQVASDLARTAVSRCAVQ
jgi:hypothetical protein